MKRRAKLARKSSLRPKVGNARKSGIRKVNRKRKAANHERAYGAKRDWIVQFPCCACGYDGLPSDPAHVGNGGMSRKAGSESLVPLCKPHRSFVTDDMLEGCHRESHRGIRSFEAFHVIHLAGVAKYYEAEWQRHRAAQSAAPHQPEFSDV